MAKLISRHAGAVQLVFVIAIVGTALLVSAALDPEIHPARAAAPKATMPVSVILWR